MEILLKIIHILSCVFLILVVLLQSGRGGGMGAAFGGASGQIFGGRGAGTFLSRLTSGAAVVFFLTALSLSMLSSRHRSVVYHHAPKSMPGGNADDANRTEAEPNSADGAKGAGGTEGQEGGKAANSEKSGTQPAPADSTVQPGKAGAPASKPDTPQATPPGVPSGR